MTIIALSVDTPDDHAKLRRISPTTNILCRDYLLMRPVLRWLKDIAPGYARGILVDYGCGNKPYLPFFQGVVSGHIGVDVNQNVLNTVDIVVEAQGRLPFEDTSIDTVLSTQVLEHVAEPVGYLSEVSRVLRTAGRLILTCPGSYMLHEEPNDYFRYTRYGLEHLLQQAGFRILRIDCAGGAWRLLGQTFLNHKVFGRKIHVPILSRLIYSVCLVCGNVFFSSMDQLNLNEKDTLNYMVVAEKIA